jgi:UDP-glucose 4-epimerase
VEADRRAGDPPALYADSSKAQQELGWQIQYTNVKDIIATAWKWHQSHPNGFDEA